MQLFIKTSEGKVQTIDLDDSHTLQTFINKIQQVLKTSDNFYLFDIKNNCYIPLENLQAQIKRDLKIEKETTFEVHNKKQIIQPQYKPQNLGLPIQGGQGFIPFQQNNQFQSQQPQLSQQVPPQQQNQQQFTTNPYVHIQQPIQNQNIDVTPIFSPLQPQQIAPQQQNQQQFPSNQFIRSEQPRYNQNNDAVPYQQPIQNQQNYDVTPINSQETQNLQKQLEEKDNQIEQLKQKIEELQQKLQRQQTIIDRQKRFIQERCPD